MPPNTRITLYLAIAFGIGTAGAWMCCESAFQAWGFSDYEAPARPVSALPEAIAASPPAGSTPELRTVTTFSPGVPVQSVQRGSKPAEPTLAQTPLRRPTPAPLQRLAATSSTRSTPGLDAGNLPTRRELQQRAQRAEQAANHELNRLIETLDLNQDQQEFVFEMLVRNSAEFLPVMSTGSGLGDVVGPLLESTESVDEAIATVLDEGQAEKFNEDAQERQAWWWATLQDFIPEEELPEGFVPGETFEP